MSKGKRDVDGNAMASAAAFNQQVLRLGEALLRTERLLEALDDDGVWVTAINVKTPVENGGEYLAIIKARTGDGQVVGFHAAPSFAEVVKGLLDRLQNRSIKWREDKPYGSI